MSEVTVPMDDKELMNAAFSDAAPEQASPEPEPVKEDGPARDEHGRFAPKVAAEAEPVAEQPKAEPEKEQGIPSWRLKEEAEARRAAEARVEEFNRREWQREQEMDAMRAQLEKLNAPKQEPIDPYADLNGAIRQTIDPFENRLQSFESKMLVRASRAEAIVDYGKQAVVEMEAAIEREAQNRNPDLPALGQRMRSSDHPIGEAMKWYQNHKLITETGGDIEAFKAKLAEDPKYQAFVLEKARAAASGQTGQKPTNTIQLPPSLNKATSSLSNEAADNDMSDAGLWRHAVAR
jgi:hypothetical protein